ncbi:hypothetical protein K474DRAFT_1664983 [Panus rudis PR-1116 ss-1]|nr:hypothetical protein K474DRAFT_1664983 [Panus rudis PR-1116 ss-1]
MTYNRIMATREDHQPYHVDFLRWLSGAKMLDEARCDALAEEFDQLCSWVDVDVPGTLVDITIKEVLTFPDDYTSFMVKGNCKDGTKTLQIEASNIDILLRSMHASPTAPTSYFPLISTITFYEWLPFYRDPPRGGTQYLDYATLESHIPLDQMKSLKEVKIICYWCARDRGMKYHDEVVEVLRGEFPALDGHDILTVVDVCDEDGVETCLKYGCISRVRSEI